MLVVHTSAALAVGGQAALDALVAKVMSDLSAATIDSDVVQVGFSNVRPIGQPNALVSYNENPTQTDEYTRWIGHRAWVRSAAEVAALRNTYEADVVVMLVGDHVNTCGVAYNQSPGAASTPCSNRESPAAPARPSPSWRLP